ncbi:MAG: hypothetical protein NZ108_10240, partial [Bacteroidia bacterium]|nr:hypothetical protein [Bacteroidia bacterium]
MKHCYTYYFICLLSFVHFSCTTTSENRLVAQYKDKKLFLEELKNYLPSESLPEDSVRFAKFYIEQWIKEQALTDSANQLIPDLETKINVKINDYKRKLIIQELYSHLIQTRLDTVITNQEILKEYQS